MLVDVMPIEYLMYYSLELCGDNTVYTSYYDPVRNTTILPDQSQTPHPQGNDPGSSGNGPGSSGNSPAPNPPLRQTDPLDREILERLEKQSADKPKCYQKCYNSKS